MTPARLPLLLIALAAACGDDEPPRPPDDAAPPALAGGALWRVAPADVRGMRFESRGRVVLLDRRDGQLWGRVERIDPAGGPAVREFPLRPEAGELFAAFAAPVPIRSVGPLDLTNRARHGLDDGTLVVDLAGGHSRTLLVGARVEGGTDRYAADPAAKLVVVLPAAMFDPLDHETRLALRDLVGLDEQSIGRLAIERDGRRREATLDRRAGWTVPNGTDDESWLAGDIVRAAVRLVPADFAAAAAMTDLAPAGRLTLTAGAAPPAVLELFTRGADEVWVRSPTTRGLLARVSSGAGRRIIDAARQLTE